VGRWVGALPAIRSARSTLRPEASAGGAASDDSTAAAVAAAADSDGGVPMLREVEATLQHYISCKLLVSLAAGVGVGCAYAVRAHSQTRDTCDMG
jgi:hypothetical protein